MRDLFLIFFSALYIPLILLIYKKILFFYKETRYIQYKNKDFFGSEVIKLDNKIIIFNREIADETNDFVIRTKFSNLYNEFSALLEFYFHCGQCTEKVSADKFIEFLKKNKEIKFSLNRNDKQYGTIDFIKKYQNEKLHNFLKSNYLGIQISKMDISLKYEHSIQEMEFQVVGSIKRLILINISLLLLIVTALGAMGLFNLVINFERIGGHIHSGSINSPLFISEFVFPFLLLFFTIYLVWYLEMCNIMLLSYRISLINPGITSIIFIMTFIATIPVTITWLLIKNNKIIIFKKFGIRGKIEKLMQIEEDIYNKKYSTSKIKKIALKKEKLLKKFIKINDKLNLTYEKFVGVISQ